MKKQSLLLFVILLFSTIMNISQANELMSGSWNFASVDQQQVSMNRMSLFCKARPEKCPVGMSGGSAIGGSSSGTGLVSPNTSASANNISVVLAGDNSSVMLSTAQDAQDNQMNANSETEAEIDYSEVLNYENI